MLSNCLNSQQHTVSALKKKWLSMCCISTLPNWCDLLHAGKKKQLTEKHMCSGNANSMRVCLHMWTRKVPMDWSQRYPVTDCPVPCLLPVSVWFIWPIFWQCSLYSEWLYWFLDATICFIWLQRKAKTSIHWAEAPLLSI